MIKAIIFDCFGVLVASSLEPFCDTYFPHDAAKLKRVRELDRLANSGQMTYPAFTAELAQLAGVSAHEAARFLDNTPPNIELLAYIRADLKPHYKIGFLSNAPDNWMDELFTPEDQQLFDDIVLSFEHGMVKPDADIFELAAQRLGVRREECVLVDDLERYCDGARAAGMQAIVYGDFSLFKQQLQNALQKPD